MIVDRHGRTSVPGIWAVGDATLSVDAITGARRPVALAGPANRAGRLVADDIIRPETARWNPRPVGTAIVRVGSLTAALTGANRMALDAAGTSFRTLHLHANQHAGYFPSGSQIHLVVHIDPDSGRLLGAQAVGAGGRGQAHRRACHRHPRRHGRRRAHRSRPRLFSAVRAGEGCGEPHRHGGRERSERNPEPLVCRRPRPACSTRR